VGFEKVVCSFLDLQPKVLVTYEVFRVIVRFKSDVPRICHAWKETGILVEHICAVRICYRKQIIGVSQKESTGGHKRNSFRIAAKAGHYRELLVVFAVNSHNVGFTVVASTPEVFGKVVWWKHQCFTRRDVTEIKSRHFFFDTTYSKAGIIFKQICRSSINFQPVISMSNKISWPIDRFKRHKTIMKRVQNWLETCVFLKTFSAFFFV